MRKIFWALPVLALAGILAVVFSNGHDPGAAARAESERTNAVYDFDGDDLSLEAKGEVRITVLSGPAGKVFVDRKLSWTGSRRQDESWRDDRLVTGFTCDANCGAAYTVTVPEGTKVWTSGPVTCVKVLCER